MSHSKYLRKPLLSVLDTKNTPTPKVKQSKTNKNQTPKPCGLKKLKFKISINFLLPQT